MGVDHELVVAVTEYIQTSQKVIAKLMGQKALPLTGEESGDPKITYEDETEAIRKSVASETAQAPHDFTAAVWTHPNGHPRCAVCGAEERVGGRCDGNMVPTQPGAVSPSRPKDGPAGETKYSDEQPRVPAGQPGGGEFGAGGGAGAGQPVKAKRGDLVVVVRKTSDFVLGRDSKPRTEVTIGVATSVSRDGIVKTYRGGIIDSGTPVGHDQVLVVPASAIDVEAAYAAAREHSYPGHPDQAMPFESVDEARQLLTQFRRQKSVELEFKYSDDEPRDDHGRWGVGGGDSVPDRAGNPIRAGMDIYDAETGERGHVVAVRRDDTNGHHLALVHLPHFTNAAAPTGHHIVLSQSLSSTTHGVYPRQNFAAAAMAHQAAQAEYGPHGSAFAKEAKGDVSGHEFHGNRFTGGLGGGLRPEIAARAAHVMDQIIKAEAEGKCTNMPPNEHDPSAPGRYSAARQAQHDAIINAILDENKGVPIEHKAWIMGGLGGAGKTTLLSAGAPGTKNEGNPITMPDGTTQTAAQVFGIQAVPGGPGRGGGSTPVLANAVNVNADDITERMAAAGMLPEVDHLAPMEMSYLAHEEASTLSHELADRVIARGQNMIWDVTLGSRTSGLDRISQLKEAGYKVTGVFVDVSVDHSISAALTRYQRGVDDYAKGVGLGGRYVPPSLIEQGRDGTEAYSKNRLAFDSLVADGAFDKSVVINNENGARRVVSIA